MSSPIELTDDDESLRFDNDTILLSEDENDFNEITISDDELPSVELQQKKSELIRKVFPKNNGKQAKTSTTSNFFTPSTSTTNNNSKFKISSSQGSNPWSSSTNEVDKVKDPGINRMIEGVSINLPVNPYGCQVALMSMLIKAIKRGQNCLLESPTGSGKTLALLCGALGWVASEKQRLTQLEHQQYYSDHPILGDAKEAKECNTSPQKNPHELFTKNNFGEKSIYDKPTNGDDGLKGKLQEFAYEEKPGLVKIHKRKRENSQDMENTPQDKNTKSTTPEKKVKTSKVTSTDKIQVPTIYYGARTHKQLQQVIKEFKRTSYCGQVTMSILASREYSCIREFDKNIWKTKNDMCKGCVKKTGLKGLPDKTETNCQYYDNRMRLNHTRMPPAFDLEDLVAAGHELTACPYFAAREMACVANIVFCPYNYIIEPTIRSSMRIGLENNIVIIDEAHNIEDTCRDAATFTFSKEEIIAALGELEHVAKYRYQNDESMSYVDYLIKTLKDWDYWFSNQKCLLEGLPINNNEAIYQWKAEHFVKSLDNHNIGFKDYYVFKENAQMFCMKLRDEPDSLLGVSSATGALIESIDSALGYLFRDECKFMDDFVPALVRSVYGDNSWRTSQFRKSIEKESISLRLLCMNPAIVFESLKVAKCIVLASGTLTPLISLHSELGTEFPLKISPSHVIPPDRVWIGTLTTHPDGRQLECKSRDTNQIETQDSLGETILWVCSVTPNGVLCFLPSYQLLNNLVKRWKETGVWGQLDRLKNILQESRNVKDHNEVMEDYYQCVNTDKGAILFAVYRGKVSEGMDFRDHQARAVITIGIPYPNVFDMAVKAKMEYNSKYAKERNLLTGQEWLKVQAYRALNQAVGRCVRHRADWGAVLMVDARFQSAQYTHHLSRWVVNFLQTNHHTYQTLIHNANSLESFMQNMKIKDTEDM